jgi:8-oxo-dGTP diphosphatase
MSVHFMTERVPQFGAKSQGWDYRDRESVYGIALDDSGRVLLVWTKGKLVLPGGGVDAGETPEEALCREILEETGWKVSIRREVCRANQYIISRSKGRASNKHGRFYLVKLEEHVGAPTEYGHDPLWVDGEEAVRRLYREFQRWALQQCRQLGEAARQIPA